MAGFDARFYRNRLGPDEVHADDLAEVAGALAAAGPTMLDWYGVRLLGDQWGSVEIGEDFEALVDAEQQAGRLDPYRGVCALTQTLARRSEGLPARSRRPAASVSLDDLRTGRHLLRRWRSNDVEPFMAMNAAFEAMEFFRRR